MLGGLYGAVTEFMSARENAPVVKGVGIPDEYISQGTQEALREECGLTTNALYDTFYKFLEKISKKY